MRRDLAFESPELESEFFNLQCSQNARLEKQFHLSRCATWAAVLIRALLAHEWRASVVVFIGTVTTLLPAFADRLPRKDYLRLRIPVQVFDNVLQVALGCYAHHHIYPSPKHGGEPSTFQAAIALLTGNGVAWQLFCSLWGSLPFRVALPQQAALTILLLLFNRPLCSHNDTIQSAYSRLAQALGRWARAPASLISALHQMLPPALTPARSCEAAVLAAPAWAAEAVRAACIDSPPPAAASAASLAQRMGGEPAAAAAVRGAELCLHYQPASQLFLGFLLPVFCIWTAELRLRWQFLAHKAAVAGQVQAGQQHPVRLSGPQPCLTDFLSFAVPAMAAMYSFVAAF